MERIIFSVNTVQFYHIPVKRIMIRILQHIPVLLPLLIPLTELAEFISHKIQFLTRMHHHIHVHRSGLRKFSIVIPVHFLKDRRFPVYHFVMTEFQHIIFMIEIHHRKCQFMIIPRPILRSRLEILQRVMHESQIPFIVKSEAALLYRLCHPRVGSRVLCDEHRRRMALFQPLIHGLQEIQRRSVHTASFISLPVDQPADRVHPKPVKMKFLQPVIRRRLQETAHLSPGMHEITASPLTFSYCSIWVLIQTCSVKFLQAIIIHRKMHRNKIHNHSDSCLMAFINQLFQLIRCPIP